MNFRIIENSYDTEEVYEKFIQLYNDNVPMKEMQKQLGFNNYKYRKFRKQALSEGRINDRRKSRKSKYYYKTSKGSFVVSKRNKDGEQVRYGYYKTESEAQARVRELKQKNWSE